MREDASHPPVISQGSLECREEFRVRVRVSSPADTHGQEGPDSTEEG